MEEKKQHITKDITNTLIKTGFIFGLFLALLLINRFSFVQGDQMRFIINGLLTGVLLVVFLFSIGGLKFDILMQKTILITQLSALLWRLTALLAFFLYDMTAMPVWQDFVTIISLGVLSILFDWLALRQFKALNSQTLLDIIIKHKQTLSEAEKKRYKDHLTMLKKMAFVSVVYFFLLGSFDYTQLSQTIWLSFMILIVLTLYLRILRKEPTLSKYILGAIFINMGLLLYQYIAFHYLLMSDYIVHFFILWLSFSPIFGLYVYYQTKLDNDKNYQLTQSNVE